MTDTERSQRTTELMTRYGTDIKRFCLLQLRDASQAENAAQDVFIKVWRALSTFRGDSSEKTWLWESTLLGRGILYVNGRINEVMIQKDIQDQGKHDIALDKLNMKEYEGPFKGGK